MSKTNNADEKVTMKDLQSFQQNFGDVLPLEDFIKMYESNGNGEINVENPEPFEQDFGDVYPLADFIEMCETNELIDYDGYAEGILLDKKVILNNKVSPSEALRTKKQLLDLNARFGNKLEIVWYNR